MTQSEQIAQYLLQIKAIKLSPQNPFTWASGLRSPIYCDNRITLSYPDKRNKIKHGLADLSKSFESFNMVAGVATAGIAHGALLADTLDLPFCYVRAEAKSHGRQNKIEGEIIEGANILVVEDLISTGGSSIQAVEVLRSEGHNVIGVISIFDYGFQKAINVFNNHNCKFLSLSNYDILIKEAQKINYISSQEADLLMEWNKDPLSWSENYLKSIQ